MKDPLANEALINHACEVLRRFAMDLDEANENDDLVFEADYALEILEHPDLQPTASAMEGE